jgi:hypothetical protein
MHKYRYTLLSFVENCLYLFETQAERLKEKEKLRQRHEAWQRVESKGNNSSASSIILHESQSLFSELMEKIIFNYFFPFYNFSAEKVVRV